MLNKKRSTAVRWYIVAENLDMEQTRVRSIIDEYFKVCKEDLFSGHTVNIMGFAKLVPNVLVDDFVCTTAMYCKRVSNNLSITYYTVKAVMTEFFKVCTAELHENRPVNFKSMVLVQPKINEEGVLYNIRVHISRVIVAELASKASCVTSARAYPCKVLKSSLRYVDESEVEKH